jgi:predicted nucleic acid-binding protein
LTRRHRQHRNAAQRRDSTQEAVVSALIVDTSAWITWLAEDSASIDDALDAGRVHVPVFVAAELLGGPLEDAERRELQDLLAGLPALGLDLEHWFRVGALAARLLEGGLPVATRDVHVAQCALDVDGELLTEEPVFGSIARVVPLRLASPAPPAHVH